MLFINVIVYRHDLLNLHHELLAYKVQRTIYLPLEA